MQCFQISFLLSRKRRLWCVNDFEAMYTSRFTNFIAVGLYFSAITQSVALLQMFPVQETVSPFREKIVHFDLKGAPPKLDYYEVLFGLLNRLKVNAVLMEYEDMFPYSDELSILRRNNSYSVTDLETILKLASDNNLEVIPLVQTFGHMQFVLKHQQYAVLRENFMKFDTICPSDNGSWHLITEMLRQVRALHPNSRRLHIGADEAYTIGKDFRCSNRLANELHSSTDRLKLEHITRIAKYARNKLKFTEVLAWNDMFAETAVDLLKEYNMGELVVPVIWGYAEDVTRLGYFPLGMFGRYAEVFPQMLFGSAFKGANGVDQPFSDIQRYLMNQKSYIKLYEEKKSNLEGKIRGIILTGWQRYDHFRPLCEIFPVGVPSLVVDLTYLNNVTANDMEIVQKARELLNCPTKNTAYSSLRENVVATAAAAATSSRLREVVIQESWEDLFLNCSFPGSRIYDEMEKLHRHLSGKERLTGDLETIWKNIRILLKPYFYDDAIDEIVGDQLNLAKIGW